MRQHWKLILVGFAFFAPFGCADFGPEGKQDLRIVFGETIATVRIGDSESDVLRKLGPPARTSDGDFDGILYYYLEGTASSLLIGISFDPALGLGVLFVEAERPYPGRTVEGIGIDSDRAFVLSIIGNPDKTYSYGNVIVDTYDYQSNKFEVTFEKERVLRIRMMAPDRYKPLIQKGGC